MNLSEAIVVGISGSAVPGVSREKILEAYGPVDGPAIFDEVVALVREAASMPIEWGAMSLVDGVDDIMARFGAAHPELTREALFQIGRCVGWQWR
ncbi:hypothetical protein [Mycobacterium avium]|uniref:hypothetical protein n=1 Tax=Mycobacterium avium TaxID=1764 RepID=UPI00211CBD4D|nr:hypothetical protein [Mycobacterium avium]